MALRAQRLLAAFPASKLGLYDMIGNVWEWTDTPYAPGSNTIKGGSYLCAENFCQRYRSAARQGQEVDFSSNHIGFRIVKDVSAELSHSVRPEDVLILRRCLVSRRLVDRHRAFRRVRIERRPRCRLMIRQQFLQRRHLVRVLLRYICLLGRDPSRD